MTGKCGGGRSDEQKTSVGRELNLAELSIAEPPDRILYDRLPPETRLARSPPKHDDVIADALKQDDLG